MPTSKARLYNISSLTGDEVTLGVKENAVRSGSVAVRNDQEQRVIGLVQPSSNARRFWDFVDPTGMTIELAIGAVDQRPTGGTFDVTSGGDGTGLSGLAYNITAAAMKAALEANPDVTSGGATVTVTKIDDSTWHIKWSVTGARNLLVVDEFELVPDCSVTVTRLYSGTGIYEEQVIRILQRPYAYNATWDAVTTTPTIGITRAQTGTSSVREIQRIALSPDPYDGTFILNFTRLQNTVVTCLANTAGAKNTVYIACRADAARKEVTTITTAADAASGPYDLDGAYISVYDEDGPVYIWFNEGGASTPPSAPYGGRLLEVAYTALATANDIALAIRSAVNTDGAWVASDPGAGATLTLTDAAFGARTAASTGTTSFPKVQRTTTGAATTLHDKVAAVIYDADGPVQILLSNGTDPLTTALPSGGRSLIATFATGDSAASLATAIKTAIDADATFDDATIVSSSYVSISVATAGVVAGTATAGSSSFGVTTILTGANSVLHGTSFTIYDDNGKSVGVFLTDTGDDPTEDNDPGTDRIIKVTIGGSDNLATIGDKVQAAVDADSSFTATDDNAGTVTIVNVLGGPRTQGTDNSTGFTVATTIDGATFSVTVPVDATESEFESILGGDYDVKKTGTFQWDVTFDQNGAQDLMTAVGTGIKLPLTLSGSLNLNTVNLLEAFSAVTDNPLEAIEEIQVTFSSGEVKTVYRGAIQIYRDVIDLSTLAPSPLYDPITPSEFVSPPATSADTGITGQYSADDTYAYFCYATDSWLRIAGDSSW